MVAQFVLASVRSAAEMEVTGASTVHVSGEQVWQLLAPGLTATPGQAQPQGVAPQRGRPDA